METDGSASREAVSGHDTPSSVGSSARRHCKYRSFAQRQQWRREGQHRRVSHLCSPRMSSHGILRAQSTVTVTGLAQCCLTLRSSGAPTAGHQRPAGGTLYIFAIRALAPCRCRPLNSNVRPRENHPLKSSIRLALEGSPRREHMENRNWRAAVFCAELCLLLSVTFLPVALKFLHIHGRPLSALFRQRPSRTPGAGAPSRAGTGVPARHAHAAPWRGA